MILTITGIPARMGFTNVGGTAPAYAAIVALSRSLSAELGPHGVRVVCLMPHAIPETATIRENFARYAKAAGVQPGRVSSALREHDAPQASDDAGRARKRRGLRGLRPGQLDDRHGRST